MKRYENKRVLVFSCIHMPYHHPDSFEFLKALKAEYDPDRIINCGDTIDNNSISFHPKDPDLFSPGQELLMNQKKLKELEEIFPAVDEMTSNHGMLVHRKVIAAGLPRGIIKKYNDIYGVGRGWKFHHDLTLTMSDRSSWYFTHGKAGHAFTLSKNLSCNVACGHHHHQFFVQSWMDSRNRISYGVQVGTLIDDRSRAFNYNKASIYRPMLGACMILEGVPVLIPMQLSKSGKWLRRV